MFPLLLITVEDKNTIRNFYNYIYHKLAKFDQNRMIRTIQNCELFYKKLFQMVNILTYR